MTVLLPSSVAGANLPLVLALVPAAFAYALAHPKWRRLRSLELLAAASPTRRANLVWLNLFTLALLVVLGASLEKYHASDCPNSAVFQFEIDSLARWLYGFSARQQVPYWVMFGNVLFVLRGYDRIPVGDTDSDIAIEKTTFLSRFGSVDEFARRAKVDAAMELQMDVHVVYLAERELIQIFLNEELYGSHADIWLYKTEGFDTETGTPKFLVNEDRTIRAKKIPYDEIMPLQEQAVQFLGTRVSLPKNPEYLAQAEYGRSYMTPLTTRLECMENLWNGYAFYKAPRPRRKFIGFVMFSSAALTLLLAYCIAPLNVLLLQSGKKKGRSARSQPPSSINEDVEAAETNSFLDKDVL